MGITYLLNQRLTLAFRIFLMHLGFQIMDGVHAEPILLCGRFDHG
jgi:hypothetical protein